MRRNILIVLIVIATVFLLVYLNRGYSSTFIFNHNGGEVVYTSGGIKAMGAAVIISGILMGIFLMTLFLFSGLFLSMFFIFFIIGLFFLGRAILFLLPLLLIFALFFMIFKNKGKPLK